MSHRCLPPTLSKMNAITVQNKCRHRTALFDHKHGVRVRGAARGVRAHRRRAAGAGARTTPPARRTGSRGTGSWWWRCSRGSSRITGSRPGVRDPGAGNEKGSAGERGRVPAPQCDGAVAERRVACAAGGGSCSPGATGSPRIPITARASRSGTCSRGIGRRWPRCLEPGSTRAGGRCARPMARDARAWTRTVISRVRRGAGGRSTSGCARSTRGIRTRDGRRVGKLPRAYGGDTGTVRDPAVLLPALARKPRAWGESPIRADFPDRLRLSIDAMESRERQRTLRLIHRASESAGFDAAARAAEHLVEQGHGIDEASLMTLARRIAAGETPHDEPAPDPRRLRPVHAAVRRPEGGMMTKPGTAQPCVCSMELWPVEHRVSVQLSGGF